jgi:hypothetical protein
MHGTPKKDMADRLGMFPEAWKPKEGDQLIGTITELGDRDGGFGDYPVITVITEAGDEYAVHGFHTVLKSELGKLRPTVGDQIGIAYHGKDEAKGYERYRVIVDRKTPAPTTEADWARHTAEAQAELGDDDEPPPYEEADYGE